MDEPEKSTYAKTILDAAQFEQEIDCDLTEICPHYAKIGFDPYDGSIEVYVGKDTKKTEELLACVREYGFTFGWMNFSDETEIHFHRDGAFERVNKSHPHWNEQRHSEHMGG